MVKQRVVPLVLELENIELKFGSHSPSSGEMCFMEAVAYFAGEPWSASPQCASPVIAAFMRSYNDSVSNDVRQTLKPFIPKVIGTRGSSALEERRSFVASDWLIRVHTPAWLRLAGLSVHADALANLPEITALAQVASIQAPLNAARIDAAAARTSARIAAWTAAASMAAAGDAAGAAGAARDAACDAAGIASKAAAGDAAGIASMAAAGAAARIAAGAARDAACAAWTAARDAAGAALRPTVIRLQSTIPALIEKMIAVKE